MSIFTYAECLAKSIDYFQGDELAAKVFIDKYALRNNNDELLEDTPEKMHWRIAKEFARIEKKKFKNPFSEQEIFDLLNKFKYIVPQGSPMFGIGNNYQTISLSNCYVLDVPLDSYSSILQTDEQLVNISKRRGGVGIDLSNLRPQGTPTKNAGKSATGISTWMERYSNSIREVGQHGRRGALMLTLSIHHPEVELFATIKNDDTKVTGANISLRLTKEFLNAVKNDKEYELRWPIDAREKDKEPKISKMVKARDIWKTIIHSAWLRAEPGLLMWDNFIENTPADCYEEYASQSTNPCQPSWAKLLTPDGIRELKDVKIGDSIWSETGWTKIVNKWSTGIKKVYEYRTNAGCFYGTENHKLVSDCVKIEAKDCESIDILAGEYSSNIVINPQDVMDGLVFGDGSAHKASNNLVHLCIGENDSDYFQSEVSTLILKQRTGLHDYAYEIKTTITYEEIPKTFLRHIPNRFVFGDKNIKCGFLRGLYSANGSICGNRITLKASSFDVVEGVQLMLSSLGIKSYYTTNKATNVKFINGEYLCKQSYDLNISTDREKFYNIIGFIQHYKTEKLEWLIKNIKFSKGRSNNYNINSVSFISEEEVFDLTVDNVTHTYWTQGCNVSNCSELNLSSLDSCRLLCLNLFSYVKNPFTKDAEFDFELFYNHAQQAQRLMDDLVDLESEKIEKIISKIEDDPEPENIKRSELEMWRRIKKNNDEGRRTGTGITALGDVFAALNIEYGSEESISLTNKIYKKLKLGCYRSSVDMAKELGAFKVWDYKKEKDNPFLSRIERDDEELYQDMKKYGRRNISLTTTAPTGSVSILTQTTSGIEPLFMMGYKRRKKVNHNDPNAKIDFVDQSGDKWQEFIVYHPKIQMWMDVTGEKNVEKSPWNNCCAEDIDWINRVKLQATAQKHVCHAISSTINLPENVKEERVAEIYETAFSSGCKGITVYRKNCRTGVLVENTKKVESIQQTSAPKRPESLPCAVHHIKITKKLDKVRTFDYLVMVGLLNGQPYEVFVMENGHTDIKYESGFLKKKKRGEYDLILEDKIIENITKDTTESEDALTRITSTALRHGAGIEFVVHQLEKTQGDMLSFAKAMARALKKHIKDGTKVHGDSCPNCPNKDLVRQEGCITCNSCGWTKCG